MMMMSPFECVVICDTMSNVHEKSGHLTCTLFGNIALYQIILMTSSRNAVTCCDLSQHVFEKSLITLNLIKPSLAKLQTSHFCCIKLH